MHTLKALYLAIFEQLGLEYGQLSAVFTLS